jgi:hypothetical protein
MACLSVEMTQDVLCCCWLTFVGVDLLTREWRRVKTTMKRENNGRMAERKDRQTERNNLFSSKSVTINSTAKAGIVSAHL